MRRSFTESTNCHPCKPIQLLFVEMHDLGLSSEVPKLPIGYVSRSIILKINGQS